MEVFFLSLAALLTSLVSGVTGMAGGVMLLSLMTFATLPLAVIVPVHGIVQLSSNSFRLYSLNPRTSVHWPTMKYFAFGSIIGGLASYFLVQEITDPRWFLLMVCALLLYVVFKPKRLPDIKLKGGGFFLLGMFTATIGPLIGTIGPFLAPFFVRDDFSKETIVASKACAQAIIHLLKLPVFLALSFPYHQYLVHLIAMTIAAYIGNEIGVRILQRIDRQLFMRLVKLSMLLISLRLIYRVLA